MSEPRIVTGQEAADAKTGPAGPQPQGATAALLSGEVLHYPDEAAHFSRHRLRTKYGSRLRTRLDGKGGQYFWVEPIV